MKLKYSTPNISIAVTDYLDVQFIKKGNIKLTGSLRTILKCLTKNY